MDDFIQWRNKTFGLYFLPPQALLHYSVKRKKDWSKRSRLQLDLFFCKTEYWINEIATFLIIIIILFAFDFLKFSQVSDWYFCCSRCWCCHCWPCMPLFNHLLPSPRSLLLNWSYDGWKQQADISLVSMDTGNRGHCRQPPEARSSQILERHEFHRTKSCRHNAARYVGGRGVCPCRESNWASYRKSASGEYQWVLLDETLYMYASHNL